MTSLCAASLSESCDVTVTGLAMEDDTPYSFIKVSFGALSFYPRSSKCDVTLSQQLLTLSLT